jgi:leader peptidase (prepilin peptidase) / N-methyltransferase
MITSPTAWAAAPLWLLMLAGLAGLAAGRRIRRQVGKFSPADPPGSGSSSKPMRTWPAFFELLTAALFAVLTWRFGLSAQLPAYLYFSTVGITLATIDLRHRLLPNAIVLPALGIMALLLTAASALETGWDPLLRAAFGGLILFALYLVLAIISPKGMGMGDVKLSGLIGMVVAFQSWHALFTGTFLGFAVGAGVSIGVLASRRGALKSSIPFGPSMLAGAIIAVLWL